LIFILTIDNYFHKEYSESKFRWAITKNLTFQIIYIIIYTIFSPLLKHLS